MKRIKLTNDEVTIVNDEDFGRLNQRKWYCQVCSGIKYAARKEMGGIVYMHRLILGTPKDKFTDHINHNGLDNRRGNLRVSDAVYNGLNRRVAVNNRSGMTGVSWNSQLNKWKVCPQIFKQRIHLGYFESKSEAFKVCKEFYKNIFL